MTKIFADLAIHIPRQHIRTLCYIIAANKISPAVVRSKTPLSHLHKCSNVNHNRKIHELKLYDCAEPPTPVHIDSLLKQHRSRQLELRLFFKKVALCDAALRGYGTIVRLLIASGVDPNARFKGHSALVLASSRYHRKIMRVLIAAGANVNIRSQDRKTPLMQAACLGYKRGVEVLLDTKGINVGFPNADFLAHALYWGVEDGVSLPNCRSTPYITLKMIQFPTVKANCITYTDSH